MKKAETGQPIPGWQAFAARPRISRDSKKGRNAPLFAATIHFSGFYPYFAGSSKVTHRLMSSRRTNKAVRLPGLSSETSLLN